MKKNHNTVIFSVSHIYLFWSTGVFYIWELTKKYPVVIVAEESFKKDKEFLKICELANILDIVYLPVIKNPILRHFLYSKKLKILMNKYRPFLVLQHNHCYAHNIYLFYWAKEANRRCVRGVYLNGSVRKTDSDIIVEEFRNEYIDSLVSGFTKIKTFLKILAKSLSWAKKMLDNYILPKIFTGNKFFLFKYLKKTKIFVPPKEHNYSSIQLVDFYLTYYPIEKMICEEQFEGVKILQICHPLETSDALCYDALSQIKGYELKEEDIVLIFPSSLGFDDSLLEQNNLSNWLAVIRLLKQKFPDYRLVLKLHPRTQFNPVSQKVSEKILSAIPAITILEPKENAEKWILKSKVIAADVSTTLWWANFFSTKLVISFDMHDFVGSDDMKYYEGIFYFCGLEDFSLFEPPKIMAEQKKHYTQTRRKLPTLNEVLESYHTIYEKTC